ncbi:MAG: CoA pyrophosphatase [Syntrophomonas sp.]|nr:CoA pyrophosphatase [Syntrophomonas sp.]
MIEKKIEELRGRKRNILGHERTRKSAVLLPLIKSEQGMCILFEKRSPLLKHQPGEICFPGGGIEDSDEGTEDAAVRETCEELGLGSNDIEIIAPLDILVTPFNAIIYPYVGYIKDCSRIQPNSDEVEEVFCVPLRYLLKNKPIYKNIYFTLDVPEDYPFDLIPLGKDYPFKQAKYPHHFYIWKDKVIWGLTAWILSHFLSMVSNCEQSASLRK